MTIQPICFNEQFVCQEGFYEPSVNLPTGQSVAAFAYSTSTGSLMSSTNLPNDFGYAAAMMAAAPVRIRRIRAETLVEPAEQLPIEELWRLSLGGIANVAARNIERIKELTVIGWARQGIALLDEGNEGEAFIWLKMCLNDTYKTTTFIQDVALGHSALQMHLAYKLERPL